MDEVTFTFGSFRLIPAQRMLFEDARPLHLGSRALDILVTLVARAGQTIPKDDLIARIWADTVVEESTLRVHVAALRKALGDGHSGKRYIANIPGRGYSFVAPVAREQQQPASAPPDGVGVGGNLPASLTRIVGRADTIAALATQLAQRRFLTIVGAGGIGKTTVAVAVAETLSASCRDGVWFVGLASLADPELVPSALSSVLGISLSGVNPASGLTGTFGWGACQRPVRQPQRSSQTLVAQWIHSLPSHGWCDRAHTGGHFDVDHKGAPHPAETRLLPPYEKERKRVDLLCSGDPSDRTKIATV